MSYELQFGDVLQYWPELAMGAWRTVYLSAISMVIGMAIAVVGALGKTAGGPILRFFVNAYIETIRNTPFLVQVLLIFFGLPALGIRFSPDTATVIALVVNVSAYAIEIIRAGIESISKGQLEAGAALGLRPLQIFRYIVLKPSIQAIYPALTSQFILLMLNSSVCVAIHIGAFREKIARYSAITNDEIRANLLEFQSVVVPEAERLGVDLCIHPNDPPNSLFGLPLAASTPEDFNKMFAANPSPANGLTWCLGSLSVGDPAEALSIGRNHADRIRFAHLRVVSKDHDDPESFHEAEHLSGEVDLIEAVDILLREEDRRSASGATAPIPMRPDHGHRIADDLQRAVNPGYSFYGRLKGLAELRGAAAALRYVRART